MIDAKESEIEQKKKEEQEQTRRDMYICMCVKILCSP